MEAGMIITILLKWALSSLTHLLFFLAFLVNSSSAILPSSPQKVQGKEVARARIGSGQDELGVTTPEETNPEGPMSVVAGAGGEIYVLDQTNSRVQVFKAGKRIKTIPIPGETFIDLELMPDGRLALLDNLVNKQIILVNQNGQVDERISLSRAEIPQPEGISGIYCRREGPWAGLWAELENRFVLLASKAANLFTGFGFLTWRILFEQLRSRINLLKKIGNIDHVPVFL